MTCTAKMINVFIYNNLWVKIDYSADAIPAESLGAAQPRAGLSERGRTYRG